MTPFSIVYVPCRDEIEAKKIARELIKNREAFCVNIIPNAYSVYTWKGKTEEAEEVLVIAKTRAKLVSKVMKRIKELHSYDLPEIISLKIEKTTPEVEKWLKGFF